MFAIRELKKAASIEEAWTLNQKKANRIIGGMGWMKMQSKAVAVAIDLSDLGLDTIQEEETQFVLGAMVTLRQIETNQRLNEVFHGAFREAVRHIVGIQFRNCATIGGSIWMRFGFSDPLTLLLALDTEVVLYTKEGLKTLPLEEFTKQPYNRDVLVELHVKKTITNVAYETMRNTATDIPVLAAAVAEKDGQWRASVGARPGKAALVTAEQPEMLVEKVQALTYHGNIRGSERYRRHLAGVLVKRCAAVAAEGGKASC
jgi:CO/xanthine dehydrogenase FAD-binding subunit